MTDDDELSSRCEKRRQTRTGFARTSPPRLISYASRAKRESPRLDRELLGVEPLADLAARPGADRGRPELGLSRDRRLPPPEHLHEGRSHLPRRARPAAPGIAARSTERPDPLAEPAATTPTPGPRTSTSGPEPAATTTPTPSASSPAPGSTSAGAAGKTTFPTTPPNTAPCRRSSTEPLDTGLLTAVRPAHPVRPTASCAGSERWRLARGSRVEQPPNTAIQRPKKMIIVTSGLHRAPVSAIEHRSSTGTSTCDRQKILSIACVQVRNLPRVRRQGLEPRIRGLRGRSSPLRSTTTSDFDVPVG